MKKYTKIEVSEKGLEDLVRANPGLIEDGLVYVDHQKQAAGGRLDVLMVDSGKSLVLAELKVVQDDGMLLQGLDYYDHVSTHVESYARLYRNHSIDPTEQVRLFLIAPSFSQAFVNRCKWFDLPISLFTFTCLQFEGEDEIVPVFSEHSIPTLPPPITDIRTIEYHLNYITDDEVRSQASAFLDEMKSWKPGSISLDAITWAVSIKVNGSVFAYLSTRRKFYVVSTYDSDDDDSFTDYRLRNGDDLANVRSKARTAMERVLR